MPFLAAIPAVIGAAAIGGGASLAGGLIASHGANQAADTQAQAANNAAQLEYQSGQNALDFQKQQYANQQAELNPFLQSGYGALANLDYLMGITPQGNVPNLSGLQSAPTAPSSYSYAPNANIPPTITSPIGTQMPNPAFQGAMQRQTYTADPNSPGGITRFPGAVGAAAQGAQNAAGGNTLASLVNPSLGAKGSLMQPWTEKFQAPTNVTEQNDPGYQFRLNQGMKALQNSAAARGDLFSGNTGTALNNYAQDYASNEYGNVYNRALNDYQQRYNIFQNNQSNQFNRLSALMGGGQTAANQLVNAGQNSANSIGSTLMGTANQVGNQINNAGAARASGYVGSSNALGVAIGGIGNNLSDLLLLQSLNKQNQGNYI